MDDEIEIFGGNPRGPFWVTEETIFIRSEDKIIKIPLGDIQSHELLEEMTLNGQEFLIPEKILPELRFVVDQAQEIMEHKSVLRQIVEILNQLASTEEISVEQVRSLVLHKISLQIISPIFIEQCLRSIHTYYPQFEYIKETETIRKKTIEEEDTQKDEEKGSQPPSNEI